jgi:hypothetical protein
MHLYFFPIIWFILSFLLAHPLQAQQQGLPKEYQFVAYNHIPTWKAVVFDWNKPKAVVHLFDVEKYKGHGNYVCYGLKTGLKFSQFKELVRHPQKRQYLPIFLYDLRANPLVKNGQQYTWAVRVEDYSYTDDPEAMGQTVARLMQTVEQYLKAQLPTMGKGIAILTTSKSSLPNWASQPKVVQAGYRAMTLSQLIAATANPPSTVSTTNQVSVEILNEGVAVGYLKYIKDGKEGMVNSNFKHILLYERLPYRVPIANGILTLAPQTPFSHINLLAKNRKTVNAYFTAALPSNFLATYENQLVKITTQKTTAGSTLNITKISAAEAQPYWSQQRQLALHIPEPDLSVQSFSHFDKGAKSVQTINCIGAKASNYALLQHHLPSYTRKGFAIPFYFYFETIKSCGADRLIQQLLNNKDNLSPTAIKNELKAIREKITQAQVPASLYKELEWIAEEHYKGKKIRLRSSTNCEDLPTFNGAGLYESKGFWQGAERAIIRKKLLTVYASLWLDRAFEEREFFGINHQKVAMAILINEAFPDEYADGVALTLPNSTGTPTIHINTQYGEVSVTNPEGTATPEVIYFRQFDSKWYVTQAQSSIHNIFVDNAELTPLVRQLQKACAQIDRLLKKGVAASDDYGVDIEFKIMKEATGFKLYIKQARLLHTLPE